MQPGANEAPRPYAHVGYMHYTRTIKVNEVMMFSQLKKKVRADCGVRNGISYDQLIQPISFNFGTNIEA